MSASYRFILCDDAGRKIIELDKVTFAAYSRTTQGLATIQLGRPYQYHKEQVPDIFGLDWRIDVWRSAEEGFPERRESSFFLMKYIIYERIDGIDIIEFFGRSPIEILRRSNISLNTANYSNTDSADDIMKDIVRFNVGSYAGGGGPVPWYPIYDEVSGNPFASARPEFTVEEDTGEGPSIAYVANYGTNVLDALKAIKNVTISRNLSDPTLYNKVYFDVIEGPGLTDGFGYIFKTYINMRGQDRRTSGLIFSVQNGNLGKPSYYEDFLDSITFSSVITSDFSDGATRYSPEHRRLSRWNSIGNYQVNDEGYSDFLVFTDNVLAENAPQRVFNANFLNTPGGPNQPRSLYGVDWDLGDLVRAEFADKSFDVEIRIVYVSVDEKGKENVVGSTEIAQ